MVYSLIKALLLCFPVSFECLVNISHYSLVIIYIYIYYIYIFFIYKYILLVNIHLHGFETFVHVHFCSK